MGKGSAPRPYGVPREQFDNNFDAIFRKKEWQEEPKQEPKQEPRMAKKKTLNKALVKELLHVRH
jgi:hypothetical protein